MMTRGSIHCRVLLYLYRLQRVAYWLISDKMTTVFEGVDPDGFALARCSVLMADGTPGPAYWLCDITRVNLVSKEDVVGSAHIFRMAHRDPTVICDQRLKDTCKTAGLKGIKFKDAANY